MNQPVSIIIPAHNEEKVLAATLNALLPGLADGSVEIVVVCNGCTDSTAKVAASTHPAIICLETPVASKPQALNLGDAKTHWFPRIYQDADVVLTMDAVNRLGKTLRNSPFLAASPAMHMDLSNASWGVRSYYAIWQKLPHVREGMIGVGVYALSEQGRQRFDTFPDIIADDGYIRTLFRPHERTVVEGCWSLVRAPKHLQGLLKIKTRSRRGQYELARKFPQLMVNERKAYGNALLPLICSPNLWPQLAVYLYVNLMARRIASRSGPEHGVGGWERDETSRDAVVGADGKSQEGGL